jgi:hypothetical protein
MNRVVTFRSFGRTVVVEGVVASTGMGGGTAAAESVPML